jgi:hypothetical protein
LNPKTPAELQPQFDAFVTALGLVPSSPTLLQDIRDPEKVPWSQIVKVIGEDRGGAKFGSFRGCTDGHWLHENPMQWQASGGLSHALKERGVRYIVVGDLPDEWFLYSIAHPISSPEDVLSNLERYFPGEFVGRLDKLYPEAENQQDLEKRFGQILSDGQGRHCILQLATLRFRRFHSSFARSTPRS